MFDANLRYHEKGEEGFCEVWSVKENTKLWESGVRKGDKLYFKMLSIGNQNPRVKLYLSKEKVITIRSWDNEYGSKCFDFLIVYLGEKL